MWQDNLDQLRSSDPETRRQAIIAIGRSRDTAALGALADVYRNDPDPALRDLAYKAGQYIQSGGSGSSSGSSESAAPSAPPPSQPAAPIYTTPEAPVSAIVAQRARGFFDRAFDFQMRGDSVRALDMLGRALETNPALRHDVMVQNLAVELTGLPPEQATARLQDPISRHAQLDRMAGAGVGASGGGGRKRKNGAVPDATWGGAFLDLGIYGLVTGAIVFVLMLVGAEVFFEFLRMAAASTNATSSNAASLQYLNQFTSQQITLPFAALYGILTAVFAIIGLLITDGAIHLVATSVLGGNGSLAGLIRKTTLYYTVVYAVFLVLSVGIALLAMQEDTNTLSALALVPPVLLFLSLIWASKLTGEAYDFGTGKGCASILLGQLALSLVSFCCSFTLSIALTQGLQNLPQ